MFICLTRLFGTDRLISDDNESSDEENFSIHIERNTFVQIEHGQRHLDIRNFYFSPDKKLLPSPRGDHAV